jgi:hypothetical protein
MKNKGFWAILWLSVGVLIFCFLAPAVTSAGEKEDKKAAARIEKTEKNAARLAEQQIKWKAQFALSCPLGGAENVFIHPALGREFAYWKMGGVGGFLLRRYAMVHRAKNPYTNMTLDITTAGERAVSNMCPGGSITLVQSMPPFVSGYEMRVVWTAEGVVDGRLAFGDSSPGTLYQGYYNSEAVANRPPWVMNLNRVDQKF